jgi:transposase-like protein
LRKSSFRRKVSPIEQLAEQHSVSWLCRQMGVARSGFYSWRRRQEALGERAAENAAITAEIVAVLQEHRGFYGSPRIHQELRASGRPIGRHRIAWLRARSRKGVRPFSRAGQVSAGMVENLLAGVPIGSAQPLLGR